MTKNNRHTDMPVYALCPRCKLLVIKDRWHRCEPHPGPVDAQWAAECEEFGCHDEQETDDE